MADEERRIRARLEVDAEGDVEALDRAASNIRDIDRAAEGAAPSVDKLGDELREAGSAADSTGGALGGGGRGGGLLGGLSTAQKALAGGIASIVAFKEAYNQTREVVNFFAKEFGVDIDAIVAKALGIQQAADAFVGLGDSVAEQADLLANQQNIFDKLNLDGFTNNVEENAELLDQHFRKIRTSAEASAEAKAAVEDFLGGVGLSAERATTKAEVFAAKLKQVLELKPDIDKEALKEAFSSQIQALLDELESAGAKVPDALQVILDELGGLPAKIDAEAAASTDAVRRLVDGMVGAADPAPLADRVTAVQQVLSRFGDELPQDAQEKVKAMLEGIVNETRAAGEQLEPAVADAAAKFGIIVGAIDVLGFDATIKPLEDVVTKVGDLGTKADTAATAQTTAATAAKEQAIGLREIAAPEVGPAVVTALEKIGTAAGGLNELSFSSSIIEQLNQIKAAAQETKRALDDINAAGSA